MSVNCLKAFKSAESDADLQTTVYNGEQDQTLLSTVSFFSGNSSFSIKGTNNKAANSQEKHSEQADNTVYTDMHFNVNVLSAVL